MRHPTEPSTGRVIAAFAALWFIWGSTYLAIRMAIETLPPFSMAAARFSAAGALLYGWVRAHGRPAPTAAHWRAAAACGIPMLLIGNGCVVWAEQRVPSGLTALLLATMPLWMVVLEWRFFGGRRPGAGLTALLLAGFTGAALLVGPTEDPGATTVDPLGAAALALAAFSWAAGSLHSRRAALPASALLATAMQMLVAGALFVVVAVAVGEPTELAAATVSPRSAAALGYLVVFGSLLAFSAYVWLLRVSQPARVSTYAYVNPVVAVLLGWLVADEPFTPRMAVAATIIVLSVAGIVTYRDRLAPGPRT